MCIRDSYMCTYLKYFCKISKSLLFGQFKVTRLYKLWNYEIKCCFIDHCYLEDFCVFWQSLIAHVQVAVAMCTLQHTNVCTYIFEHITSMHLWKVHRQKSFFLQAVFCDKSTRHFEWHPNWIFSFFACEVSTKNHSHSSRLDSLDGTHLNLWIVFQCMSIDVYFCIKEFVCVPVKPMFVVSLSTLGYIYIA